MVSKRMMRQEKVGRGKNVKERKMAERRMKNQRRERRIRVAKAPQRTRHRLLAQYFLAHF